MRLNISKTKSGKWSPAKVSKVFTFLRENMNDHEMAHLATKFVEKKLFNMETVNTLRKDIASREG